MEIKSTRTDKPGPYTVYMATFPNGKKYIGITKNSLTHRRKQHYYAAKRKKQSAIQKALLKYGNQVQWEVLLTNIDEHSARETEIRFIYVLDTNKPSHGYNSTRGGECSKSTPKFKIRSGTVGEFSVYKTTTLELVGTWDSIKQASRDLGVRQSLISRCLSGRTSSHNGYIFCKRDGIHKLPELQKRSQINRKRKFEVRDATEKLLGIWDNTNQCARDLSLSNPREIRAVLNNPRRSTSKNLKFKYI